MKTRMMVGSLIFLVFFGIGGTVQKTQGHCSWDVYVQPWTHRGDYETVASLDVRYNSCALPGYYTGDGTVEITVNGDWWKEGGTLWADITRGPGEHESHGTTGEFKIRRFHYPWADRSASTSPSSRELL